jgi:glycosyltransferase involved in cell wall biosynthesis
MSGRTVLFIGYWGVDDALTVSTILPGVRTLLADPRVDRVVLATVERKPFTAAALKGIDRLEHRPFRASQVRPAALARALDLRSQVTGLRKLVRTEQASLVFARTSFAGALAHFATRGSGVPYVVESFEPHADYMRDCDVWPANGLFYRVGRRLDRLPLRTAAFLLPVAANYGEVLAQEGYPKDRIRVVPCAVDEPRFAFDAAARARVRAALGLGDAPVAIYAGKFGGLYHREHAFAAFARAHARQGGALHLIVLTPEPIDDVQRGLQQAGLPASHAHVRFVPHDAVPAHLSAADLAFATYRRTPSSPFLSPIKNGEYWANGLPVLLTRGVADDSAIIEREPEGGAVFDPLGDDLDAALDRVMRLLREPDQRQRTAAMATRHRSMEVTHRAYADVLDTLWG